MRTPYLDEIVYESRQLFGWLPIIIYLYLVTPLPGIFELGDHVKRAWPRMHRLHNLYLESTGRRRRRVPRSLPLAVVSPVR